MVWVRDDVREAKHRIVGLLSYRIVLFW